MNVEEKLGANLAKLLVKLDITPYKFSKDLGYKSPDSIYSMLNGQAGFSSSFFERLEKAYPKINFGYLLNGFGEVFINKIDNTNFGMDVPFYPAELGFDHLKNTVLDIAKRVFPLCENDSFVIRVRRALTRGLELEITKYVIDDKLFLDKVYNLLIMPDWKLGSAFEHWSLRSLDNISKGRCQNLNDSFSETNIAFDNIVFELHKLVGGMANYGEEFKAHLKNDMWVAIFCSDERINQIPLN